MDRWIVWWNEKNVIKNIYSKKVHIASGQRKQEAKMCKKNRNFSKNCLLNILKAFIDNANLTRVVST